MPIQIPWAVQNQRDEAAAAAARNPQTPAAPANPAGPAQTPQGQGQQLGYLTPAGGGFQGSAGGPQGMVPWANWMTSGGVNPTGWQSLGGAPNLGFMQQLQGLFGQNAGGTGDGSAANPTSVAPTDANSLFNAGQSYADTAYSQATRQLDPQWQQQEAQFNQQMVNQGLAPGSAAYETAKANFDQAKNDAYSQARAQSQQQGLAAQAQGFGQGLSQSQLSSQLAQALLGANTSLANQQLGGNASLMSALLGGNSNIAQQLIGGNATMNAAQAGANASRFATSQNHDIQQQNLDNGMLMQLLGLGNGVTQYNNGLINNDQNRNMQFFQYLPSGGGGSGIDVQSPYNNQYTGNMNQWNYQNQQAQAQNNMYANMMMAFLGGG